MISRRTFLLTSTAGAAALAVGPLTRSFAQPASDGVFEIVRTPEEWAAILTPAQFAILREHATEFPFTNTLRGEVSPLLHEERDGMFLCAGCELPLYSSETKYDSRTGWPSFWQEITDSVRTTVDFLIGYPRTEVHCRRCGGHLGHIFNDGPPPTYLRHCINGLALTFVPGPTQPPPAA